MFLQVIFIEAIPRTLNLLVRMSVDELQRLKTEVAQLKENYEFLVHFYRSKIAEKVAERNRLISKTK